MKFLIPAFILMFIVVPQDSFGQVFSKYRWKNRILLLIDEKKDSKVVAVQLEKLKASQNALLERDIIIILVHNDEVQSSNGEKLAIKSKEVYTEIGISNDFKGLLLLGKDGGVKLQKKFMVAPETIFDLIDSMPMRRSEMRNDN